MAGVALPQRHHIGLRATLYPKPRPRHAAGEAGYSVCPPRAAQRARNMGAPPPLSCVRARVRPARRFDKPMFLSSELGEIHYPSVAHIACSFCSWREHVARCEARAGPQWPRSSTITITMLMLASKAQQINSYRIAPQRRRTDQARQTDRQHEQRGYDDYSLSCMLLLLFNIHLTPMMVKTAPFECRCCRPCRRENQLSTWETQSVERECCSVLSSDQSVVLSSSLLHPRLLPSLSCWADNHVALPCPPLSRSLLMKAHAEPPHLYGALPRVRND
ncbi:hypothetical protein IWZ03DRAFT_90560 [Phyllosticta citriasiana]|uniref:Uncharacterized protein n=1 Tax=Phyllosticta citriasiana TaxID=595635 RepID=A0ABR1K858_9PEZI